MRRAAEVGLRSFLSMLRPRHPRSGARAMTRIPGRPQAQRAGLALGLALLGWLASAPAPAQRAYVSNEDDGTVSVVDLGRQLVLTSIEVGKRPRGLVLSPDGATLYVAVSGLPKCPPPIPEAQCEQLPRDREADGVAVIDTGTLRRVRVLK